MKKLIPLLILFLWVGSAYGQTTIPEDTSFVWSWETQDDGKVYHIAVPCTGVTLADSFVTWPIRISKYRGVSVSYYYDTLAAPAAPPAVVGIKLGYEQSFQRFDTTFALPYAHSLLESNYHDSSGAWTTRDIYPSQADFIRLTIYPTTSNVNNADAKFHIYIKLSKSPISMIRQGGMGNFFQVRFPSPSSAIDYWYINYLHTLVGDTLRMGASGTTGDWPLKLYYVLMDSGVVSEWLAVTDSVVTAQLVAMDSANITRTETDELCINWRHVLETTITAADSILFIASWLSLTEAGGLGDSLETIGGGVDGDLLYLSPTNASRTIVIEDGVDNIVCGADFTMDDVDDFIVLIKKGATWCCVSKGDNQGTVFGIFPDSVLTAFVRATDSVDVGILLRCPDIIATDSLTTARAIASDSVNVGTLLRCPDIVAGDSVTTARVIATDSVNVTTLLRCPDVIATDSLTSARVIAGDSVNTARAIATDSVNTARLAASDSVNIGTLLRCPDVIASDSLTTARVIASDSINVATLLRCPDVVATDSLTSARVIASDSVNVTTLLRCPDVVATDSITTARLIASDSINTARIIVTDSISVPVVTITDSLNVPWIDATDSVTTPRLGASDSVNVGTLVRSLNISASGLFSLSSDTARFSWGIPDTILMDTTAAGADTFTVTPTRAFCVIDVGTGNAFDSLWRVVPNATAFPYGAVLYLSLGDDDDTLYIGNALHASAPTNANIYLSADTTSFVLNDRKDVIKLIAIGNDWICDEKRNNLSGLDPPVWSTWFYGSDSVTTARLAATDSVNVTTLLRCPDITATDSLTTNRVDAGDSINVGTLLRVPFVGVSDSIAVSIIRVDSIHIGALRMTEGEVSTPDSILAARFHASDSITVGTLLRCPDVIATDSLTTARLIADSLNTGTLVRTPLLVASDSAVITTLLRCADVTATDSLTTARLIADSLNAGTLVRTPLLVASDSTVVTTLVRCPDITATDSLTSARLIADSLNAGTLVRTPLLVASDSAVVTTLLRCAGNVMTSSALAVGVGIMANMTGVVVEGGVLGMKEITTPTPDGTYGKIYTKTDNNLYFQDGGGTEHTILKGSSGIQHEFFTPLESPTGTVGNWDIITINATQSVHFSCQIPEDFEVLDAATIVMIPDATEEIQWDVLISVSAAGEAHDNDDREALDQTLEVTADLITEIDISGSLTGLSPGDYIAIDFQSDTGNLRIVGFEFDFN